jgi:hypothetical protein
VPFVCRIFKESPLFIFASVKNKKRYSKRFEKKGVGFGAGEKELSSKVLFPAAPIPQTLFFN